MVMDVIVGDTTASTCHYLYHTTAEVYEALQSDEAMKNKYVPCNCNVTVQHSQQKVWWKSSIKIYSDTPQDGADLPTV